MLRQSFHAPLHILPQAFEIARRLLSGLAHAARGGVELTAHLFELLADLGDDRLEAAFEVVDRTRSMTLRFLAQALDLGQRCLRLTCGVVGQRRADLLRPRLRLGHGIVDHSGIRAHHVVEVLRLGVDGMQERDDRLVPALQDRVDLGVRRIERLGGREDGLSLILEALREAVNLLKQPARDLA